LYGKIGWRHIFKEGGKALMRKLTIFSWIGFPISMEERFKYIKAAGFDGIMLWWSDQYAGIDGDKSYHPDKARKHGLFIENIHTPIIPNNYLWEDSINGDDMEKLLTDCINDCYLHNIPTAIIHVTYGFNPPPVSQTGIDRFRRMVEAAESRNVNIALENLLRPEYLEPLLSGIESERLGFCYDSGHENSYTRGTDLLSQYGSKLIALHLHDNDGVQDLHLIPGEGNIDWNTLMKKISATGYTGPIALEIANRSTKHPPGETPESFLEKAFYAAKRLRDLGN
jgi:sugar phosphate isomerase/epimerase